MPGVYDAIGGRPNADGRSILSEGSKKEILWEKSERGGVTDFRLR